MQWQPPCPSKVSGQRSRSIPTRLPCHLLPGCEASDCRTPDLQPGPLSKPWRLPERPLVCSGAPSRGPASSSALRLVYQRCTPDAHRMHTREPVVHPVCIRCASLVLGVGMVLARLRTRAMPGTCIGRLYPPGPSERLRWESRILPPICGCAAGPSAAQIPCGSLSQGATGVRRQPIPTMPRTIHRRAGQGR